MSNGAKASNVFWQVGSSATLGTGTIFAGSILALQSVTLTTSATTQGSVYALNGAVTLDSNTIKAVPEAGSALLLLAALAGLNLTRRTCLGKP